ncbi:MAG: site-specific integrase [Phycisphaeraceae bacterium]|nr:site-specific integrase [Phycisphaeraceae bacterium]
MFYEPIWEYEGYQLVKRPDTPNYCIYWNTERRPGQPARGVRRSTRTSDLAQAKQKLVEFVREVHKLRPLKKSPDNVLILDAICDYIETRPKREVPFGPAHFTALKHATEFVDLTGLRTVGDFGLAAQYRYVEWRKATLRREGHAASNGTMNRELGVFKAAFRHAWKWGHLDSVPHIQMLPSPPPRDRFLRPDEVRRLLEHCNAWHLRLFVMLALHTLQRPIAILSLRVEQVDLRWNRIDFLPPGATQSAKRRPVVPITPSLRPYLETAIESSELGYIVEYLGHPVGSVKGAFGRACRAAGLGNVSPYVLRHTGATLMAAAGVPLRQIAGMMGHSETRTTELYAKHHPDFLRDASRALEELFGEQLSTTG